MELFFVREVGFIDLLSLLPRSKELGSIDPDTAQRFAFGKGVCCVHAWPVSRREHKAFLGTLAEYVLESIDLYLWLSAQGDGVVALCAARSYVE